MGDALKLIDGKPVVLQTMDGETHELENWDLLIAHPPCTYLSNAGARHLWKGHQLQADRVMLGIQARDFFMRFWLADIPKIAVENPIPSRVFAMPEYTQAIQPWQFGHPYTKKTCLWLKNLPPLAPTNIVEPIATWCPSGSYSHRHGAQHKGMFTTDRAKNRSKTFEGIAEAMAEQWGGSMTDGTLRLLSILGYGERNAMTRGTLCALLGMTDRTVRKLIEEARREEAEDGPFIVNACEGKGYFLTTDADEIERHYRGEYSRAMSILVRTKGERKYLKKAGRL